MLLTFIRRIRSWDANGWMFFMKPSDKLSIQSYLPKYPRKGYLALHEGGGVLQHSQIVKTMKGIETHCKCWEIHNLTTIIWAHGANGEVHQQLMIVILNHNCTQKDKIDKLKAHTYIQIRELNEGNSWIDQSVLKQPLTHHGVTWHVNIWFFITHEDEQSIQSVSSFSLYSSLQLELFKFASRVCDHLNQCVVDLTIP